jgi:7-cyano-7-deazaguanine synthase
MKRMVVLSGGQDSVTCLYWALARSESVVALTFDYGQRHRRELDCAAEIAKLAGVPQQLVNLGALFSGSSPLTDFSREVEHYESADTLPGGLEDTFVPGRNMLFLAVAANRAYVENCDSLVVGVSQEDFGGYPDCRESFIKSMENTIAEAMDRRIPIEAPLLFRNKRETVDMAAELDGCWKALALSHTCYEGQFPPCGECHSCLLRSRGFQEAGRVDPLIERCANAR